MAAKHLTSVIESHTDSIEDAQVRGEYLRSLMVQRHLSRAFKNCEFYNPKVCCLEFTTLCDPRSVKIFNLALPNMGLLYMIYANFEFSCNRLKDSFDLANFKQKELNELQANVKPKKARILSKDIKDANIKLDVMIHQVRTTSLLDWFIFELDPIIKKN